MIPDNRALVQRLQSEPFALIGVNTDKDKDEYKKKSAEHEITWRSAWQGGTGGPIPTEWRVSGYPTLFLLDHKGVIRNKWIGNPGEEAVNEAVDKLAAKQADRMAGLTDGLSLPGLT